MLLLLLILHATSERTLNCCKWGGRNICGSYECCPTGGEPILNFVNGSWTCKCKILQQCPEQPTFRPTYPPIYNWPSPPTPQPQPTTMLPSTHYPTIRPYATYRPTTHPPSPLPTSSPTTLAITNTQETQKPSIVTIVLVSTILGVTFFFALCLCFCIMRKRNQRKMQEDFFVVLSPVP